ncbi:hypothetical protein CAUPRSCDRAFT_12122 [Caulochytrium protostelioides]|uniref:Uncharacterized protein n=1 Tax=Caulochytrium protostelioides TaxID=1555241 RepID=A0A4P9WUN1_9FUNG|nr:hypothetical protein CAUPRSCDRAFT_12122 [Caulochytrium protostelioides]
MRAVLLNEIKDHTGSNIRDPLTEFALAIQNLDKSLPVSEALTGESDVPRFEMVDVARVSDNFETVHQRFVDVAMAASPPTQSSKTEIDSLFWFVEALDTMVGPDTHREPWIDWLPELDEQGLSKVALRQLAEIMKFNGLQVNRHHVLRLSIAYADLLKLCSKDDAVSEISEVHQLPHGYNMLSEYERYSVIVRASWLPREMTYQHRFESAMQAVLHARGLGESMVDLSPENFQSEMNRYVDEIASYYVSERERVRSDLSEFKNKNPDWPPASFTVNDYFSQLINAKLNRHFVDKTRQWLAPTKTSGHANRDAAENSRFISRQNPLRPVWTRN